VTFRLPVILLASAVVAGPALIVGTSRSDGARSLSEVEQRARAAAAREQVLTGDVTRYSRRVRAVEVRLAPVQARWTTLNAELTGLRGRRIELTARLDAERRRLATFTKLLAAQRGVLAARVSAAYRTGEPTMLQIVLRSGSLSDAVSVRDNLERLNEQDRGLIVETRANVGRLRRSRDAIRSTRAEVYRTEQQVAVREAEAKRAYTVIATERNRLVAARGARAALLSRVKEDRRELEAEARGLRARSARLAAQIRSSSSGLPSTVAVGGGGQFSWPVNGPITSSFGWRWGRMHEGIDIGAPMGAPIGASASGRVIVAGWSGGYGNLVVVSHGSIATAYAHMSRIAVSVGQEVGRGTVLGAVGCTGHCFGPHVHFEVRVNGVPQNPVNYL